jgi:hypothetical protein
MKKYIPLVKFVGIVAILYSTILFVLSHIPEILAGALTMFIVHCGLQGARQRQQIDDKKPQDKTS